jgi:hypothetical protein
MLLVHCHLCQTKKPNFPSLGKRPPALARICFEQEPDQRYSTNHEHGRSNFAVEPARKLGFLWYQVSRQSRRTVERSLKIFHDLGDDDVWREEIRGLSAGS